MNTLEKRLAKLEQGTNGKGRVISVRAGDGCTNEDMTRLLAFHGIVETPNDMVVILRNIFAARAEPPVLVNVVPTR